MATITLPPPSATAHQAPPPDADANAARYWERLREPAFLMARDLDLARSIPRRRPLLDVGCGNGGFVRACLDNGIDALGVEAFSASSRLAARSGAPVLQGTGESLPIATGAFDLVRLKEVLEHVQQPLSLAKEMRRALRPNGVFLAYVPTQWSQLYPFPANFYDDYTHVRPFSRIGLQRLLEDAGFTDIRIEGYTPPLRAWQRPVGAIASRIFPFLWRAVAANGGPHAL